MTVEVVVELVIQVEVVTEAEDALDCPIFAGTCGHFVGCGECPPSKAACIHNS